MANIIIVGFKGKMGSVVYETLEKLGYKVMGIEKGDSLAQIDNADLLIDFGGADSSVSSVMWCEKHDIPIIVGSTGQTEEQLKIIENASRKIAVLKAGNFSLGVLAIKRIVKELNILKSLEISIFEKHHSLKLDKPSGTALELSKIIKEELNVVPEVLSERGGREIGTHTIDFYFGDELISLTHKAFSRQAFANGVAEAVKFMLKSVSPRLYKFEEIF